MQYNFDEVIDRRGTNAVKLERCQALFGTSDIIPLWVADMDFKTPDFIIDAIRNRLEHPILGYTIKPRELSELFVQWVNDHHQWEIRTSQTDFVRGIVPALSFAVQCFTNPGDEVMLQSPVYHPFFHLIKNNGRSVVNNPLITKNGRFEIDFEDFERKISAKTRMFIFCSPHNPGGRVWDKVDLLKIDEICSRHNILVVSDEIHADMVLSGHKHIPFASISESAANNSISFMAPSKVFNMPGVISSSYIIPNSALFRKYTQYLEVSEMNSGNLFAYEATLACYRHGEAWRVQMLAYIEENVRFLADYLTENLPQIKAMIPQASFLVWLDCIELGMETDELHRFFSLEAGLGLNKGTIFGDGGEKHLRINVATPRSVLAKALVQLKKAVDKRWK